jgi:methyltransferase (TIGR00027 family)
MDSFALRNPSFAQDVDVIEIDHPATQAFKIQRLSECEIPQPARLHFVPADLSTTSLDNALGASPFRRDRAAFFAWLGVTPYLTRAANVATLAAIASCAKAGSELVFTYLEQSALTPDAEFQQTITAATAVGEPFLCGFEPHELDSDLSQLGLELIEDLGPVELTARYCADRTDGLTATSPGERVAHTRVRA